MNSCQRTEGVNRDVVSLPFSSATQHFHQISPYYELGFSFVFIISHERRLLMDGGANAACQPGRAEASVLLLHSRAQAQGPGNCVSFPSHRKVILRGDVSSSPRVTAPPGDGRRAFVSSTAPPPTHPSLNALLLSMCFHDSLLCQISIGDKRSLAVSRIR